MADMYTVSAASRAFVYRTAADADAGHADRKDCAAVILYAAENATRIALDAIQARLPLPPAACDTGRRANARTLLQPHPKGKSAAEL